MNIYLHELRRYQRNTLLWMVALCAGTAFVFSMFPAFAASAAALNEVLKNYPEAIQKAFGLDSGLIGTVTGFYSFIVTFLMVCGAVQAMNLGISLLTKETTGKTADFLLTKPVRRSRVLTAKFLAACTCMAITSAFFIAIAVAMAEAVKNQPINYSLFMPMSISFFFIQLIFLALGFLIGAAIPKIRSVLPLSLSVVFGFFILGMVASALDQKNLYYLSPFKYFDTTMILQTSSFQADYVVTGAAVTALAVLAAYAIYTHRDIHAA